MSDLASSSSSISQELKDDASRGRDEQEESEAVEGRRASVSGRSSVLSFRRVGGPDGSREAGEPGSLDPMARPAYQTSDEGTAHKIYQFGEEPLQMKPIDRNGVFLSKKTELDIRAFVEAVAAAFPKPRDPQMARVIRARPKRAARPFLYVAEEQGSESEIPAAGQSSARDDVDDRTEHSLENFPVKISRNLDVLLYDPILEGALFEREGQVQSIARARKAEPQNVVKAAKAGMWTSAMPDRRSRKRELAPVQAHERPLIEAVIEPLDPVANPKLPVLDEKVPGVPARLSPFQRAQLQRPKMVRDCNGRMTVVEYRVELIDPKLIDSK